MHTVEVDIENNDVEYRNSLCLELESGNILTLAKAPYTPSAEDCAYLRTQNQTASTSHKNIAYKPDKKVVTGISSASATDMERTTEILSRYSRDSIAFMAQLLPAYSSSWKVDYASFRPVEELGRELSISHRNDLMHLDAFPTRPTNGGRILRAFTNIHPQRERVWGTSYGFDELVRRYAKDAGLLSILSPASEMKRLIAAAGSLVGVKAPYRSPYDDFMLKFHHHLKANGGFQETGEVDRTSFGPGVSWIALTDMVAHRVTSGQYAIEQTIIVPVSAMVKPELSPVNVLSRVVGRPLAKTGSGGKK